MGVYNKITISTTDLSARYESLVSYLNSLSGIYAETYTDEDWDLGQGEHPSGVRFSFEESDISCFFAYVNYGGLSDWARQAMWVKNKGADIYKYYNSEVGMAAADMVIHSYLDDNCKIISIKDFNSSHQGLEVMLLTIDSKKLIGYKRVTSTDTFDDISTLTFEDTDDVIRVPLTYTNMFPYSAPAGTVDFLAQAYFVNNGVKKYTSTLLKECSTVSLLSTVSLPYPLDNHLAIGAHCIVPLDPEGGDN